MIQNEDGFISLALVALAGVGAFSMAVAITPSLTGIASYDKQARIVRTLTDDYRFAIKQYIWNNSEYPPDINNCSQTTAGDVTNGYCQWVNTYVGYPPGSVTPEGALVYEYELRQTSEGGHPVLKIGYNLDLPTAEALQLNNALQRHLPVTHVANSSNPVTIRGNNYKHGAVIPFTLQ